MTKTLYKVQGTSSIKIGSVDWLKQSSSRKESEEDQVWPRRHIKFKGHQALKMSTLSLLRRDNPVCLMFLAPLVLSYKHKNLQASYRDIYALLNTCFTYMFSGLTIWQEITNLRTFPWGRLLLPSSFPLLFFF